MIAMCSASTINTDHLRSQLDQLHSEAHITRTKANNARFRLLRLSEAAENLRRQAALSVRKGKENDARELLFQKKKIMSALEKSKGRVELLDELAAKLNEAISIKEAQLVRDVASDLDIDGDDAGGPVRIVSPTQDDMKILDDDNDATFNRSDVSENQEVVPDIDSEGNMPSYCEAEETVPEIINSETETNMPRGLTNKPDVDNEGNILSYTEAEETVPESINSGTETNMSSSFRCPSSYIDFLEDLDQQLNKIENDLVTSLELPALVLENEEKPNNSKVQQMEILENIRSARKRIRKYVEEIAGNK